MWRALLLPRHTEALFSLTGICSPSWHLPLSPTSQHCGNNDNFPTHESWRGHSNHRNRNPQIHNSPWSCPGKFCYLKITSAATYFLILQSTIPGSSPGLYFVVLMTSHTGCNTFMSCDSSAVSITKYITSLHTFSEINRKGGAGGGAQLEYLPNKHWPGVDPSTV